MSVISSPAGLLPVTQGDPTQLGRDPKKIHEAAVQFEALLIGQLMKSAHDASFGDASLKGDEASSSLLEMGTEHMSRLLAEKGGFGLAKLIEQGLRTKQQAAS